MVWIFPYSIIYDNYFLLFGFPFIGRRVQLFPKCINIRGNFSVNYTGINLGGRNFMMPEEFRDRFNGHSIGQSYTCGKRMPGGMETQLLSLKNVI